MSFPLAGRGLRLPIVVVETPTPPVGHYFPLLVVYPPLHGVIRLYGCSSHACLPYRGVDCLGDGTSIASSLFTTSE